jgi:1,4-alpha-glucan branching enzyme
MNASSPPLILRPAQAGDWNGIWEIFRQVVSKGDTYSYAPDTSESEAKRIWLTPPAVAYVAESNNTLVGTIPEAFRHARLGLVDAHIMHRTL